MAYLIGTYKEIINYDLEILKGENFKKGDIWDQPLKHPKKDLFAIKFNPKYSSQLKKVDELPEDWTPDHLLPLKTTWQKIKNFFGV